MWANIFMWNVKYFWTFQPQQYPSRAFHNLFIPLRYCTLQLRCFMRDKVCLQISGTSGSQAPSPVTPEVFNRSGILSLSVISGSNMRWLYCTISGIFWKEFPRMCHLQFFPPTSSSWCFSIFFHLVQQGQFRCLKLFYFSAQWRVRAPVNTVDIMQVVGRLLGAAQLQHLHLFCPEGMLHVDTKTAVTLLQLAVCVVSVSLVMCLLVGSGRSDSQRRVLSFQLQFRGCISPSKVLIALVCKS